MQKTQKPQGTLNVLVDIAINVLCVTPFLLTRYLPLTDLPNHLARQHILAEWAASPALQTYYYYKFELVPNLGVDLFVLLARALLPIDLAIRLFCILGLTLIFWGCRSTNRWFAGPAARAYRFTLFLCYGGPVQFGFLNFFFGIGLALIVFAAYLRLRDARPATLLAIFLPCAALLLLCHLAAFGICAAAIGAFEFAHPGGALARPGLRARAGEIARRELRAALFLLPAFAAFVLFSPTTVDASDVRWSTLHEKIEGLAAVTLFASPGPELALLALAMAGFALALVTGVLRVRRESIAILVVMLAIFLALPRVAAGGGYVDYRMPWAASFFLLAGVIPGRLAGWRPWIPSVCFGGLAVARVALVAVQWLSWNPTIAGLVTALRGLPSGARLMVVLGDPGSVSLARRPPLEHVAAYAVAYRQAYWAGMFADISGQILFYQPAYKHDYSEYIPRPELERLDPMYQYVLVLRPQFARVLPTLPLHCVAEGNQFRLFQVVAEAGETRCS